MKFTILSTLIAAALAATLACGNSNTNSNGTIETSREASNAVNTGLTPRPDEVRQAVNSTGPVDTVNTFLLDAARGGIAEVEMGRIAETKAADPEVQNFARMMVQDHSNANTELKALAAKKGISLPAEMDTAHKTAIEDLRGKVGAEFDRTYVDAMVEDHEKAVAEFERQSQTASDAEVKAFAAKTLPVLKRHLETIKAIQAKMQ